jgi:hypothetical protein
MTALSLRERIPAPVPAGPWPARARPRLTAGALGAGALVTGAAAAAFGPAGIAATAALGLVVMAAVRPVSAVYLYLATLPFLAGIDRDTLLPLVRPNEALLALLVLGVVAGGYLRFLRGDDVGLRIGALDPPLALFVVLSTVWPVAWLLFRGTLPHPSDLAALLPILKLAACWCWCAPRCGPTSSCGGWRASSSGRPPSSVSSPCCRP